ncbi:MAG: hypothetical protein ACREMT_05145, partial [Vulcanimicrobiaceae bacterium]
HTRLEDAVEGRSTWDSRVAQMPERDPEEPPIAEAPKPAPLPQPKAKQPKPPPPKRTKVDIPETRGFGAYDDSPALPDPVASEGYYEDDSGRPPLKLPP